MLHFDVAELPTGGWELKGTKTTARTKGGQPLVLPTKPLAEKMAGQLSELGAKSPLFLLASATIDTVMPERAARIAELGSFLDTDLVFYRAPDPADLRARQDAAWDAAINWAIGNGAGGLTVTEGLVRIHQPEQAHSMLAQVLGQMSDWQLLVAHRAGHQAGSVILGCMFAQKMLDAQGLFEAANVEELYQTWRYGADAELDKKLAHTRTVLDQLQTFRDLLA
ncbi:MAG: hypothetical protein GC134_00595 [Proteobacteria bacterium]|nr:hypothetical protein [Pseudomonadota bacterium]